MDSSMTGNIRSSAITNNLDGKLNRTASGAHAAVDSMAAAADEAARKA
jgi:hypothetical protein